MANVLLIEQEIVLRNLISSVLLQDGHTLIATGDPLEAFAIMQERPQEIDLILTAVEMLPISGFQFMKFMARKKIRIPVLFVSGCAGIAKIIVKSYGDSAVIEKPFTAASLRQSVARSVARYHRGSAGAKKVA